MAAVLGVAHSQPDFPLPAGACDCHVHVFGPPARYPLLPDRVYMPSLASVQDLVGLQKALRLERVVIVQASPQGSDNTCLTDAGIRALRVNLQSVKLSAPYRITSRLDGSDGEVIVRPLIDANPERMLWGTDWPHTGAWPDVPRRRETPEPFHPIDDGWQLNLLGGWATQAELRRILVDNPARLFGF